MKLPGFIAVVLVVGMISGCSFIGVRGPPDPIPEDWDGECTDSAAPPAVDLVMMAAAITTAVAFAIRQDICHKTESHVCAVDGLGIAGGLVIALPYGISGAVGAGTVSRCRAGKREHPGPYPNPATSRAIFDERLAEERRRAAERRVEEKRRGPEATVLREAKVRATDAADAGDCETVRLISTMVLSVDAEFHRDVFLLNAEIRRCLSTPRTPVDRSTVLDAGVPSDATPPTPTAAPALPMRPAGTAPGTASDTPAP